MENLPSTENASRPFFNKFSAFRKFPHPPTSMNKLQIQNLPIPNSQQAKRQQLVTSDQLFPTLFAPFPHPCHPIPLPNPRQPPKLKNPANPLTLPSIHQPQIPSPLPLQSTNFENANLTHASCKKHSDSRKQPTPTQSIKCFLI